MDKYYGDYRRFIYDWDYADQEKYTELEENLEDLERKEVISDEEFNNNISRLETSNDIEELEKYRKEYVSESEYFFTREGLINEMKSLESMYRVTEEQLANDKRVRADYSREGLKTLKRDYETRGINGVIRNLDVDSLTDEEVIDMYRNVRPSLSYDPVIRGREEKEKERLSEIEKRKAEVRENIEKLKNENVRSGNVEPELSEQFPEITPTFNEIEEELKIFNETSNRINNQMKDIKRSLIIDANAITDVSEEINGLENEIKELREMANVIINDMDSFRLSTESVDFSMSVPEIRNKVNEFTGRFKKLKQLQVEKYNSRVEYLNNKIREFKGLNDLDYEVISMINGLQELSRCEINVNKWNQTNYLKHLNYKELDTVSRVVNEINDRLNVELPLPEVEGLDGDILNIMKELDNIDGEILSNLETFDVNKLNQDLDMVETNINDFESKLEFNKDSMSVEAYRTYREKIKNAKEKLEELRNKLGNEKVNSNDYENLNKSTSKLENDIQILSDDIETFYGHVVNSGKEIYLNRFKTLEARLKELKKKIKEGHGNEKIDINQFNSLNDRISELENNLENSQNKLKDPGMIKDADIYSVLNGEIDGLENASISLFRQIEKLSKPISKEDRKNIDVVIKQIEKEIKRLEKLLEQYKDNDPEKYNSTMNRLNNVKERMNKLGTEYRSKCPLMVKAVKSAKNFFKKHRKQILIIAGLSAFALVAHQVLIPAIMHGNIMIAYSSSALRPFIKFCDKILGGMIGATLDAKGIWTLANGVVINPSVAATSLLKGLAISGVGTTALVAPLVVSIKQLIEKMKTVELKQKLSEQFDNVKGKVSGTIKNGREKVDEEIKKITDHYYNKVAGKTAKKDIKWLLDDFYNSGKSIEEFANDEDLTDEEIAILRYFENNFNEYKNSGRKGR